MKAIKFIPIFSIGMFILVSLYAIFSIFDIITLWTGYPINSKLYQFDIINETKVIDTKHLIVSTIYLSLNVILIIPTYWYLKITKLINKKDYYNPNVYQLFSKITNLLFISCSIPVFLPRILDLSSLYTIPEFWFNIHPTFIILFAGLLQSFSLILKDAIKHKQENELTI